MMAGTVLRPGLRSLNWRVPLALAATYAFFGSGPAGAKAALASLPPLLLVGVRGVVAGALLLGWSLLSGARPPSLRQWPSSVLIGTLILVPGAGGGTLGQRTVPSGVAGVLSALLPLLAACLGYALFRERLPRRALAGLGIGFAGVGLLLRPGSNLDPSGLLLIALGQASWALGAVLAPHVRLPEDPRVAAGAELLSGGCVLLAAAAATGEFGQFDVGMVTAQSWLGLGWLVVSAVVGFTAYGFLAKTVSSAVATTFSYVNPVVAIALGWFLFGEPVTGRMLLATAIIIAGVCLIISTRSDTSRRQHHPLTSGHGHSITVVSGGTRPRPARS